MTEHASGDASCPTRGAAGRRARRAVPWLALALLLVASAARADELADYDPQSTAWNGLAQFVALAEGGGYTVTPVTELDWATLGPGDILFLIYPTRRVDAQQLVKFIAAGGNAVIADDFGKSTDALGELGLLRADTVLPKASRTYEGRIWAPIATAQSDHPIARDVGEVVTNHPAALDHVVGATTVVGFDEGALVVAGERGTGRFVAVADPSIFINRMQQEPFRGNVQLAVNILRWLDRDHTAMHVVLLRGDVPTSGEPQSFIFDPHDSKSARAVRELNDWLHSGNQWLLTAGAMKIVAAALAALLCALAIAALPVRRGPRIDGAWLKFMRPRRRDDPHAVVAAAELDREPRLVLACMLRDRVQRYLAEITKIADSLGEIAEPELVAQLAAARGHAAGVALARVYRKLRALPTRSQAAAPWSSGFLPRRDFEALYRDVTELCRTLGHAPSGPAEA